jgi:hypothetical protein
VGAGFRDETRDVVQVVLAIGVHLQGVGEAQTRRFAQAGHHRAALALIEGQAHQVHLIALGQRIQHRAHDGVLASSTRMHGRSWASRASTTVPIAVSWL